jgi:hypothetical protein
MAGTKRVKKDFSRDEEVKESSLAFKQKKNPLLEKYDKIDGFNPEEELSAQNVCAVSDLVYLLEKDATLEIEAKVLTVDPTTGKTSSAVLGKKEFIEAYKKNASNKNLTTFREAFDWFGTDTEGPNAGIGNDYIPLLGGPFNRQMYLNSMLKSHQEAFFAFHHDPVARQAVNIIKEFTLGRGWRVDADSKEGLVLWRAFEEANDLPKLIEYAVIELALYGEIMLYWLPGQDTKMTYQVRPGQDSPKGILPRVRLMDPSTCWEVMTYPEDITRVLGYTFVFPTQYAMYTTVDAGKPVSSTKFIYQTLKPTDVDHFKINCVSNEKRGRSDLYPVFGYLKRLRDSVNYSIIGLQKTTAWSMDTEIDGNQSDIDNYTSAMDSMGTVPPPGSEFIHSKKIQRKYLSNDGASKNGASHAFDWTFSMICAGLGIPMQYFGMHTGAQGTRGNALVATEPVAKKFEARQLVLEQIIKKMARRLFDQFGIDEDIEVTFPDIVTQDRTAKLKDLAQAQLMNWISAERAAPIAAKELGVTDYDYTNEKQTMAKEQVAAQPQDQSPLTTPPTVPPAPKMPTEPNPPQEPNPPAIGQQQQNDVTKSLSGRKSGITGKDRRSSRLSRGY